MKSLIRITAFSVALFSASSVMARQEPAPRQQQVAESAKPAPATSATPPSVSASQTHQATPTSPCIILKRMGPADQITSHMYSFGIRGKQFQFVEGQLPKGVSFHGRLTDHDVRKIQDKGGKVLILEPKYSPADLEEARKGCQ